MGRGEFNVPIGTKMDVLLETDSFDLVSKYLRKITLKNCDFERTIDLSKKGDFLFVDPPYTVKHNLNNFIKYNEKLFSWDDQVRLREAIGRAMLRGVSIVLTNANHKSVRTLYRGIGEYLTVTRSGVIAASSEFRGRYKELIIRCC